MIERMRSERGVRSRKGVLVRVATARPRAMDDGKGTGTDYRCARSVRAIFV